MIMRKEKFFIFILLVAFFAAYFNLPAVAEPIGWHLQFNEDGTLEEKVIFTKGKINFSKGLWEYSEKDGKCIISRVLTDWDDYNSASDKLPFTLQQDDKLVYKNLSLLYTGRDNQPDMIFAGNEAIDLTIAFPGFIRSSCEGQKYAGQGSWHFNSAGELYEPQTGLLVKAIIIDGFNMAIAVLGIGFILLLFFFIRSVYKVKKIIEEEYSLEPVEDE